MLDVLLFGVQHNQSLRELLLGNNNITDSSSTGLIEALGLHPRLEKVLSRLPFLMIMIVLYVFSMEKLVWILVVHSVVIKTCLASKQWYMILHWHIWKMKANLCLDHNGCFTFTKPITNDCSCFESVIAVLCLLQISLRGNYSYGEDNLRPVSWYTIFPNFKLPCV